MPYQVKSGQTDAGWSENGYGRSRAVSGAFLDTRTYLCPLSTPASCDILPTQILANNRPRGAGKLSSSVGRLPVRRSLRALRRKVATNCLLQKHSPQPAQDSGHTTLRATERLCSAIGDLRPQHFWLRNKQKILSHVGSAKTLGGGRPYTTPAGPCIAYSSRPLGTDHERERRDLGSNARAARTGRTPRQSAGEAQIQATSTRTTSCRRRSRSRGAPKAAPTDSAQKVQVKSPPTALLERHCDIVYASNQTVHLTISSRASF